MVPEKCPRKRAAYGLPADFAMVLKTAQDLQTIMVRGINGDGSLKANALRSLLKFKGIEVTALAETHGYSEAYFRQVMDRMRRDIRVENAIAEALELEADRIWGRRADGAA
jgi:lambda repressor-like predicted transcriptional regulator